MKTMGRLAMGNFDYLKKEKRFAAFSDVAISTEKLYMIQDYVW